MTKYQWKVIIALVRVIVNWHKYRDFHMSYENHVLLEEAITRDNEGLFNDDCKDE